MDATRLKQGGTKVNLNLRQLLRIGRRWWWLLLILPLLGGGAAYGVSMRQQPLYSAPVTLLVSPVQGTGGVDYNGVQGSQSLAETYRELVRTAPVLDPAVAKLHLPYNHSLLAKHVTAVTQPGTNLITISVSDPSPTRAAAIANAVATSFVDFIKQKTAQISGSSRTALDQQFAQTQQQIDQVGKQISTLESGAKANDPGIQAQLTGLRTTLAQLQQTYTQLQQTAQQIDLNIAAAQSQVTVATPAMAPETPYSPRKMLSAMIGVFAGLLVAVGAVALLEYFDNTVKSSSVDMPGLAGGPILSTVANVPKLGHGPEQLVMLQHPRGQAAEAIRLLRTNIEFVGATRSFHALAITSPGPGEGKSTITANLGIAMAQAGISTVIIDADLRRPSQHRIFDVSNDCGLSTLLARTEQSWQTCATRILGENLTLLPSGPLPPNPSDLLSLEVLPQLIQEIAGSVDLVLIDTPPVLAVSDPLVIAKEVNSVILVAHSGHTRIDALRRAAETLQQGSIQILGLVLNQQSGRDGHAYGYDQYYAKAKDAAPAAMSQTIVTEPGLDKVSERSGTFVPEHAAASRRPAAATAGPTGD